MLARNDFAVMLNANARRVTPEVRRRVAKFVAPENLFFSHSEAESVDIVREIADRKFPTVFTGGGDGTFIKFINDYAQETGLGGLKAPSDVALRSNIGILHLGTGNAVAQIVSSRRFESDLESFVHTKTSDCQALPLVRAEGQNFPFAGLGIDAEILNDYMSLKRGLGANRWLKPAIQSLGGYFAAFFGKTVGRRLSRAFTSQPRTEVRITNLGDAAYILQDGEPVKAYGKGEVLYEGPMTATMFGTCPYYGHGLTILPYAMRRPGYFQLRMVKMGMMKAVAKLPSLWKGTYQGRDIYDWHVRQVKLEFNQPVPYQYGGDAQGERTSLILETAPLKVNLLRFV